MYKSPVLFYGTYSGILTPIQTTFMINIFDRTSDNAPAEIGTIAMLFHLGQIALQAEFGPTHGGSAFPDSRQHLHGGLGTSSIMHYSNSTKNVFSIRR